MFRRIFLVVLDSVGIGALPDAPRYGDAGAHTLGHIAAAMQGLHLPQLQRLGLGLIDKLQGVPPCDHPLASYGKMAELSVNKDTTSGHWELAGTPVMEAFPVYPQGFPEEITASFCQRIGRGILGNKAASGTVIIEELGEEHLRTGFPIVYTSADSVFQIAAHEEVVPLEQLYKWCQIARQEILTGKHAVGRVIARPFIGTLGKFSRTPHRHDYSLPMPQPNLFSRLTAAGLTTVALGKIGDIYAGQFFNHAEGTINNEDGLKKLQFWLCNHSWSGVTVLNLVDFDMLYGHRNDAKGYANALEAVDHRLAELLPQLAGDDLLLLTADHGCDPLHPGTDHTREYVPLLAYSPQRIGTALGIRNTFADVSATILENFRLEPLEAGSSFLNLLQGRYPA